MGQVLIPEDDVVVPVAIVGQACRFPGDGKNVEALFDMLKKGGDAWSEFPSERLNIDGFYHPSGQRQGSIGFKGAHFIEGDIKAFDATVRADFHTHFLKLKGRDLQSTNQFFNISQAEAHAIDPQQRLLLEVTYQALENGISATFSVRATFLANWRYSRLPQGVA